MERDRRIRPDGSGQYRRVAGEFGYFAADPYTERVDREPMCDRVEAVVVGGGFGGLLTGARLRQAGVERLRMVEEAGDFGGTWYWNRYPGIQCDIESYAYMPLLEEVGYLPKWRYAPGEEIRRVIFATGFEVGVSGVVSGTLPVYGRSGVPLLGAWAQGPRTLHGFYSHGFPNLFHLGSLQNSASVNFVHVLQEQAAHIGAVIAAARERGVRWIEPSEQAEKQWVATIAATAPDNYKFQTECTPGYYNNEGKPRPRSSSYGPGPVAFHELLRRWRENEGMDDVLVLS